MTRTPTSRWGACGRRGRRSAATTRSPNSAPRSDWLRTTPRHCGDRSRWGIGWAATRAKRSPARRWSGCSSCAPAIATRGDVSSSCITTTPSGDAPRVFRWFWGKRDPNLVTPWNERIAEHFRRLAYVRRHFHLLHPLSLYHRSATARGLAAAGLRSLQRQFVAIEPQLVPVASERLALAAGLGPEPRDAADQPGERSIYGLTGLDARGLVWLRHGAPDTRLTKARDLLRSLDLPGVSALDAE